MTAARGHTCMNDFLLNNTKSHYNEESNPLGRESETLMANTKLVSLTSLILIAALLKIAAANTASTGSLNMRPHNLILNPGFEDGAQRNGLPKSWLSWNEDGSSPEFRIEAGGVKGSKCASVRLGKDGRAVLLSSPVPAAPGEKMRAEVWMRCTDYKSEGTAGRLTFTAACLDARGRYFHWDRFSGKPTGQWSLLTGEFTVPPGARQVVLQLGFNYARGKVYFDDAVITAQQQFALRLAADGEYDPSSDGVPFTVINRTGAKRTVFVRVLNKGKRFSGKLKLSGSVEQGTIVPVRLPQGNASLDALLEDPEGKTLTPITKVVLSVLGQVEMEPIIPTHFCIEDGSPAFQGRVWIHVRQEDLKKASLSCSLFDDKGALVASRKWDSVSPGRLDFGMDVPNLPKGDYNLTMRLMLAGGKVVEAKQDWHIINRAQARVTLGADGYPVVDGQAIFPLGTFNSGRYELMKKTGFNVVHAWNRARALPGVHPRHQPAKDFLDDAQKSGLKAVLMIPADLAKLGNWEEAARRVRMFRNHPALLVWDEEEGVARGEMPIDKLSRLIEIVRKEDPHHPFCLADSYDVINKVDRSRFFPERLMDIGMWWWYPIPLNPGGDASALEGRISARNQALEAPAFLGSRNTDKPIWLGMQAYRPAKRADGRLPTAAEYRAMAYLAVVYGAQGMLYYMGGSAGQVEGAKDKVNRPWDYLNDLIPEISTMLPVFMMPSAKEKVEVLPPEAPIASCIKLFKGMRILIAVNRENKPLDVQLTVQGIKNVSAAVKFENRSIMPTQSGIEDHFDPYEVHVYELK